MRRRRPPTATALLKTGPLKTAPLETGPLETTPLKTLPLKTGPLEAGPLETARPMTALLLTALPAGMPPRAAARPGPTRVTPLRGEDDLAEQVAVNHGREAVAGLGQRQHPVDDRAGAGLLQEG